MSDESVTDPAEKIEYESWECNSCGAPCRIQIAYSDEKLPKHLKGKERFREKRCFCSEPFVNWQRVPYAQRERALAEMTQHCEICGGDWVDNGLQAGCACVKIQEQAKEIARLHDELTCEFCEKEAGPENPCVCLDCYHESI
jgi:hypothetical protein